MLEIEKGSEAFEYLRAVMAHPGTYTVRLEQRKDGVAIKANGGMWTPALSTVSLVNL